LNLLLLENNFLLAKNILQIKLDAVAKLGGGVLIATSNRETSMIIAHAPLLFVHKPNIIGHYLKILN
jgi:hypothetical protein